MSKIDELAEAFIEQGINSRKQFDDVDNHINESVKKIMEAYANLAEQKPEELFGLKPSERDKYFAEKLFDIDLINAANSDAATAEDLSGGDITGSNPIATGLIVDAAVKIASSEGGAKIIDSLLKHVQAEKNFFKETGKEIIGGIKSVLK